MKVLSLILAILCLSVITSAQTVVSDNDSYTIKADADANASGKFEVQTGNVPRVTVANDGKVGLGVTAPAATLHFGGTAGLGQEQTMRLETNGAGTAPYGWTLAKYAPDNGGTQNNNQFCWGYNIGPGGNKIVAAEPSYGHCMESDYTTSESIRQMEIYDVFIPGNDCIGMGCVAQRSFSITPNRSTGQVINRLNGLHIMNLDNIQQTTFDVNINFWNPTGAITFNGSRTSNVLMTALGTPILSFKMDTVNKVELFSTGIGDAEVGMFNSSAPQSVLTLNFGGTTGALNPNGIGFRKNGTNGMQVNHGSGWGKIATVLTPCAPIIDPQPGEKINSVKVIAILNCLRQLGLLAE